MSVTSVKAIKSTGSIDGEGHQSYSAVYHVYTNSVSDNFQVVQGGAGLPQWGESYSFGNDSNPYAFARTITGDHLATDSSRMIWAVTVGYTTKPFGGSGGRGSTHQATSLFQSPLDEPWKISGSYIRLTRATERDKNGAAITNSAFEPKVVEVPYGHDTLRLEGPSQTLSLSTRAQSVLSCNSATIWGLTARQIMMTQWTYDIRYFGTSPYVWNQLEFEINYAGWNEVFLDAGYREYLGVDVEGKPVYADIVPKHGGTLTAPVPLDGTGLKLDVDTTPQGVFLTKSVIGEYDFTTLGLPNPLPGPFI